MGLWMGRTVVTYHVNTTEEDVIPDDVNDPQDLPFKQHNMHLSHDSITTMLTESIRHQTLPIYLRGPNFGVVDLNPPCLNNNCTTPTDEDYMAISYSSPSSSH